MRHACLCYFNAAGADAKGRLGEDRRPETHLIPLTIDAAPGRRPALKLFGNDYLPPDDTGIRDSVAQISGHDLSWEGAPRREGDPSVLVADSSRIRRETGWTPRFADLDTIIETAFQWRVDHPEGYRR